MSRTALATFNPQKGTMRQFERASAKIHQRGWEDLVSEWTRHAEHEFWMRWKRCSIAAQVVTRYGSGALDAFGAEVKVPTGTLYKMREVYQNEKLRRYVESFSPRGENPFGLLTYSHLVEVRGEVNPVPLLKAALDGSQSARAMGRARSGHRLTLTLKVKKGHEAAVQKAVAGWEEKGWVEVTVR